MFCFCYLQLLFGLQCRAAFIVALMTLLSLYVRDSYVNIGLMDNINRYLRERERERKRERESLFTDDFIL